MYKDNPSNSEDMAEKLKRWEKLSMHSDDLEKRVEDKREHIESLNNALDAKIAEEELAEEAAIAEEIFRELEAVRAYREQQIQELKKRQEELREALIEEELRKAISEDASALEKFRIYFCKNSNKSSGILDIVEIFARFAFVESIPISIAALVVIKIAKIGIGEFCKGYPDK